MGLIDAIPTYQTIKRARQAEHNKRQTSLQVHIKDDHCRCEYWLNSMWGTNAERMQLCLDPFRHKNE